MIAAIRHSLAHIFSGKGRDGRRVYLLYFVSVVVLNLIVFAAIAGPVFFNVLGQVAITAKGQSSEVVQAQAMEAMLSSGLPVRLVYISVIMGILNAVLMSAAFVRRSHDVGLPGMIVLLPLGLHIVWLYFTFGQMDRVGQAVRTAIETQSTVGATALQPGMIAQDLIGWLAVLLVVIMGMAKSQIGSNSYGDQPTGD